MPRGVYKRPAKRGRPKGSRNKNTYLGQRLIKGAAEAVRFAQGEDVGAKVATWKRVEAPTESPTFLSRLEAATVKYEQAVNDAITALKGQ